MATIELPWGDGQLEVALPPHWDVVDTYLPREMTPAADPELACREALHAPLAVAPLAQRNLSGKRVLLVSDDVSRPTPVATFFAPVRDTLVAAGVRSEDIEVLFALGVHRPMTDDEAAAKIGAENTQRHRWHNHDCSDPSGLIRLGTTSGGTPVVLNRRLTQFDLIVLLGAVEPHALLGFSGGYKMLLPGCASAETIGHNHMQGLSGRRFNFVGVTPDQSPMRLDLEEAGRMLDTEVFVVNAAVTPEARVVRFFCGDPVEAVRAAATFCRQHSEVQIDHQVDVVITNSAPFDTDLRQSIKCLGNTLFAAKPEGVLLGFARCNEGRGDVRLPPFSFSYDLTRRMMHTLTPAHIMKFVKLVKYFGPVEDKFLAHFGLQVLCRNHVFIYSESLPPDTGRKIGLLRQYQEVEQMVADARAHVGEQATVAVFPRGGCTYCRGPAGSDDEIRESAIPAVAM